MKEFLNPARRGWWVLPIGLNQKLIELGASRGQRNGL